MRLALIGAAFVGLALSGAQSDASTSFDGNWMVHAAANPGVCSDNYGVSIRVADGHVSYRGILAAFASGTVTRDGRLSLQIGEAHVTGQLASNRGGGVWASPKCQGKWTASRA